MCYGLPFNLEDNVSHFRNYAWKLYDKAMGINFSMIMKSKLPELKSFMKESEFEDFEMKLNKNKWSLMDLD